MSTSYRAVGWNRQKRRYDAAMSIGVIGYLTVFVAGGFLIVLACALIVIEIVMRQAFRSSMGGVDELAGFALAVGTAWSFGAVLLDKADPLRVLARLPRPLLSPTDEHREGYVPNVVYTCGAIVNQGLLFMPYGVADMTVAFAFVPIKNLLAAMT